MDSKIILYLHTLRYLRPVQIYGRLWFRLYRPRPDLSSTPELRHASGRWVMPARRQASMLAPRRFVFLGQAHKLVDSTGWNQPERDKLWLYNLHYFDDLNADRATERYDWHRALIADWIADNPPGQGNGWEPYPLSLRIVNWIKWALAGNALAPAELYSLVVQIRYLRRRLEWHLLGNHLFANAKALVFAGLFFQGEEAATWLQQGLSILRREVPEQILPDGGHFERSPMYHSIILDDLLDLINLVRLYPDQVPAQQLDNWYEGAARMSIWLQTMCHPDGQIALFNDAAFDIAPAPAELFSYAERLAVTSDKRLNQTSSGNLIQLPESGYLRWQRGPVVALLDAAPLGPDYLPGHAHADTLSFELSLYGQRVVVNGGTSCYGNSQERLRQRGTAAHSTVVVDGQDSSEVWGGFRVARRAYPEILQLQHEGEQLRIACAHNGYRRLPGRVRHRRQWLFNDKTLQVIDCLDGRFDGAQAYFHLHPDIVVQSDESPQTGWLLLPDGQRVRWQVTTGNATVESSTYHPRFGQHQPNHCLIVQLSSAQSQVCFTWT